MSLSLITVNVGAPSIDRAHRQLRWLADRPDDVLGQFAPFEYGFYTGLTDRYGLTDLFRHGEDLVAARREVAGESGTMLPTLGREL